eukprot:SAG31_NODE_7412_length_1696_cov_1.253601_1_plen_200_part_00
MPMGAGDPATHKPSAAKQRVSAKAVAEQPSNVYSTLKDFEFQEKIGSGAFGTVYRVRRKVDGNVYVIKKVKILTMSRKEQESAINEVRIMASLDSPYVIKYYDSFIDGDSLNIVMELAEKGNLAVMLKKARIKGLAENAVWKLFIQMTLGVYHIHLRNIVHRDMKPLNVLLDRHSNVCNGLPFENSYVFVSMYLYIRYA